MATYGIILGKRASVEETLGALAKRAGKKGLPVPAWTWGEATTALETFEGGRKVEVTRVALTVTDHPVRFEGWTFVAALDRTDGGNVVRTMEGETVDPKYRDYTECDHCGTNRRRNHLYVVRHDDGRTMAVGSTCVGDFTGGTVSIALAAMYFDLDNVRLIARAGWFAPRSTGIAASILPAWDRAMGIERAKKAPRTVSVHFGTVGERGTFTLTLEGEHTFETAYGVTYLYRWKDAAGNVAIWKSSRDMELEKGKAYEVTGTVKEHGAWKDIAQTVLTRCKATPVKSEAA